MTLQCQKNHYNVKFLKGYGISVNLKNNKLVLKNGYDFFSKNQEQEEWFVKNMPYEKIILSGKGYVSIEALSLLNQNNRNLVVIDTFGKPVSFLNGMMDSLTATKYRMGQYDTFRDESKRKYLKYQILYAKKTISIETIAIARFQYGAFIGKRIPGSQSIFYRICNYFLGCIDRIGGEECPILLNFISNTVSLFPLKYELT